jgi:D-hydroxyproline dehydrogenase subunit gamma
MAASVEIRVNGAPHRVPAEVTLAAALLSIDRRTFHRSVSGMPRGPVCGMGICFECRVTIEGEPHRRACLEPVREGMDVQIND